MRKAETITQAGLVISLLLMLTAPSCPDILRDIVEVLHDSAVIVGEVQGIVIEASETGLITKARSDTFLEDVTVPILTAIGKATTTVGILAELEEQGKDELLDILPPVLEAVKEALTDEKLAIIPNDATRATVELLLESALLTLNTIQLTIEVSR